MSYRRELAEFKMAWINRGGTVRDLRLARKEAFRRGITWPDRMYPDLSDFPVKSARSQDSSTASNVSRSLVEENLDEREPTTLCTTQSRPMERALESPDDISARPIEVREVAADDENDPEAGNSAVMICTDPGNLWGNVNPWMEADKFSGWELRIEVIQEPGTRIRFLPFRNQTHQRGMRPHPVDSHIWSRITHGATKNTPVRHSIRYNYAPLK